MTKTHDLPPPAAPLLLLAFGGLSIAFIRGLDAPGVAALDLLVLATSFGAILTALLWFFVLALPRGPWWSLAMLVPYVNLLAASSFARRYWNEGARGPALLGIAGFVGQAIASFRLLLPELPPLV
jgi:multisubunit Na+/H+ antiporter MnhB subunit